MQSNPQQSGQYQQPFNPKLMKRCKKCNQAIAKNAKVCPYCGAKNKKPIYKKPVFWIVAVILFFIIVGSLGNGSDKSDNGTTAPKTTTEATTTQSTTKSNVTPNTDYLKEGLKKYKSGEYRYISADDLSKYYPNLTGEKVYIIADVNEIDSEKIQITISDGYMMSNFRTPVDYSQSINEDDKVAILCTVGSADDTFGTFLGTSYEFEDAYVFAVGKAVKEYKNAESDSYFKKYFTLNEKVAQNVGANNLSKDEFISLCKTYTYNEVMRNPDEYKDKFCKLTGKVDQIVEGWLGTITIYVKSSGNTWKCSYSYDEGESHILEGDNVTVYGVLDGTANATTVLGKQVTMPDVSAKYISQS